MELDAALVGQSRQGLSLDASGSFADASRTYSLGIRPGLEVEKWLFFPPRLSEAFGKSGRTE